MGARKINDTKLIRLVDGGRNQVEIAKMLGVSKQAVSKRLIELRGRTTRAVVAKDIRQIVDRKIDALEQLYKINEYANELLDLLVRWNRGDKEALQVLESQIRYVRVGEQDPEWVKEFKFKDPRELSLKAMAEIRNQLRLQLDIFQTLYDVKAVEEFQKEVLEAIGEVAPDVRNKIIQRLNLRRPISKAVHFS